MKPFPASALLLVAAACARSTPPAALAAYVPRTRTITVTTVPLLVKEAKGVYPFLKPAFAKGGVLDGKEVYAFSPSSITVVEGDTLHLTIINPEDDPHSFVLPDFSVRCPAARRQKRVTSRSTPASSPSSAPYRHTSR